MSFHEICAKDFENSVFHTIAKEWMLITAEKQMDGKPVANTMTASWGGIGWLWNKPVVFVFIRSERYTYEFMEENEYSLFLFRKGKSEHLQPLWQ